MQEHKLTQPQRLLSLILDLILIAFACNYLFDTFYPPAGHRGFWAYSAILAVLVGAKLITPFYVKPVDAITYTIPAFVSMMLINDWANWNSTVQLVFVAVSGFCLFVLILGLLNILANSLELIKTSNVLRILSHQFGQPKLVYTPLVFFAVLAFHYDSPKEIIVIFSTLITTVWLSIGSFLLSAILKLNKLISLKTNPQLMFRVFGYESSGIVLLEKTNNNIVKLGELLLLNDKNDGLKIVQVLDTIGRLENHICRALVAGTVSSKSNLITKKLMPKDGVYKLDKTTISEIVRKESVNLAEFENIVGLVSDNCSIDRLYFEVTRNQNMNKGKLVSTLVGDKKVLYQILDGLTKEEVIQQKNTYGYLRAQAQQIGIWDKNKEKFKSSQWLSNFNNPVVLEPKEDFTYDSESVGHFPDTNYSVKIKNINHLVTHNTAILGILGVGKSMLAIELVERMIESKIKVICLDLTNQYEKELTEYIDVDYEDLCLKKIQDSCDKDRTEFADSPQEGGSINYLRNAVRLDINDFLEDDSRYLKIYNPSSFVPTKQVSEPKSYSDDSGWHRTAGLFAVSPVEITQLISEETLNILSSSMSDVARVCLVYEEAHSLVPEWNSVVNDGDKNATSGTARAILQGRKYGLGCLLVTQRTANVTKTILNQCNTVFAMRTFDDTGKEFLSNYIGKDYAKTLSTLNERQAVFFGKASSCENPVLIRLNDQKDFRAAFRAKYGEPAKPTCSTDDMPEPMTTKNDLDDEIPF